MAGNLVLQRPLERPERVQVLHLDLRAERRRADRAQADVALDAHRASLHVRMAGADGSQQPAQRLAVGARLGGRPQIRLGDDLHERHARAVEVDHAVATAGVLHARRVLLQVGARDADGDLRVLGRHRHHQPAVARQGQRVLADLVALRQVGVEVVLALEPNGIGLDVAVQGQPGEHDQLDRPAIDRWQRARHAQADRAHPRIRLVGAVRRGRCRAGAEHLRLGPQLRVDLDADDRFVVGACLDRHRPDCRRGASPIAAAAMLGSSTARSSCEDAMELP